MRQRENFARDIIWKNYILEENLKDTNDYGSFADIPRNQTLVVVEGDFEKKTGIKRKTEISLIGDFEKI